LHLVQIADRTPAAQAWSEHPRGAAGGDFAAWLAAFFAAGNGGLPAIAAVPEPAEGGPAQGILPAAPRQPGAWDTFLGLPTMGTDENGPFCWKPSVPPASAAEALARAAGLEGEQANRREVERHDVGTDPQVAGARRAGFFADGDDAADRPAPGGENPVSRTHGPPTVRDAPFVETDSEFAGPSVWSAAEVLPAAAAVWPCAVAPVTGPKAEPAPEQAAQVVDGLWASPPPAGLLPAVPAMEGYAEGPGPALPGAESRGAAVASRPAERPEGVPAGGARGPQVASGTGPGPDRTGHLEGHQEAVPSSGAPTVEGRSAWGPNCAREGAGPAGTTRATLEGRTGGPHGEAAAVATAAGSRAQVQAEPDAQRSGPGGTALPATAKARAAPDPDLASGWGHRPRAEGPVAESGVPGGVAPRPAANGEVGPSGPAGPEMGPWLPEAMGNSERVGVLAADPWRMGPPDGSASAGLPGEATRGPQAVPRVQGPAPRYAEGWSAEVATTVAPRSVDAASAGMPEGGDAAGAAAQADGRPPHLGSNTVPGARDTALAPPAAHEAPVRGTERPPAGSVRHREAEAGTGVAAAGPLRVVHEGHQPPEVQRVTPALVPERVLAAVRHLTQTGEGQVRLELQLDPPGLGRLTVRLAWDDGVLRADFLVATQEARQAVEAFLPRLRESLTGLVTLAETGVWVYPDATASDWWQPARHHREPLPGVFAPVSDGEGEPLFRGWSHGGVLDCLV